MGAEGSRLYSPGEESPRLLLGSPGSPTETYSPTSGRMKTPATFSTVDVHLRGSYASKMFLYPPTKQKDKEEDEVEQLCEQITLEEFCHAIEMANSDDQVLIDYLRNRYSISTTFISQILRKVSTTRKLKVLGHVLRLNALLPVDSVLRADNDQILILLHRTVTSGKMDAFRILLPHIQNPNHYRTKTELQSLTIVAAQVGNVSAVKLLCLNYPFCLEQTKHGKCVFVQVARAGSSEEEAPPLEEILRDFVEMGVYINAQEPDGCTAIHAAVTKKDLAAVKYLLEEGACPTIPNGQGKTAVDLVKSEAIKKLLEENIESAPHPHDVSLYHAAEEGDESLVDKLLGKLDVDTKWLHGQTALAAASSKGDRRMVDHLLGLGSSPIPLGCYWPDLPAMLALSSGHVDLSYKLMRHTERYLRSNASKVEKSHIKMQLVSLLHHCCTVDATGVADMVLDSCLKINPNTEFRHHLAPAHVAAKYGRLATLKVLLKRGGDPNLPTEVYRNTPLHYACFYGHAHIVDFLLSLENMDVNIMNIGHESSLYCVLRCQLTPHEKNPHVRENMVCCLFRHSAMLLKPGRRKCELEEYSMATANQRWGFLPPETQKLLFVLREERYQPITLSRICRLAVRGVMECAVTEESVGQLGLPYRLQRYVLLKDWFP